MITTFARIASLLARFYPTDRNSDVDRVDLLYYHAPAEDAPPAEAAGFFREMLDAGTTRAVGVSNLSVDQMSEFQSECPIVACPVRYNWLQRDIEADIVPWCREHQVSVVAYEPLALSHGDIQL